MRCGSSKFFCRNFCGKETDTDIQIQFFRASNELLSTRTFFPLGFTKKIFVLKQPGASQGPATRALVPSARQVGRSPGTRALCPSRWPGTTRWRGSRAFKARNFLFSELQNWTALAKSIFPARFFYKKTVREKLFFQRCFLIQNLDKP